MITVQPKLITNYGPGTAKKIYSHTKVAITDDLTLKNTLDHKMHLHNPVSILPKGRTIKLTSLFVFETAELNEDQGTYLGKAILIILCKDIYKNIYITRYHLQLFVPTNPLIPTGCTNVDSLAPGLLLTDLSTQFIHRYKHKLNGWVNPLRNEKNHWWHQHYS